MLCRSAMMMSLLTLIIPVSVDAVLPELGTEIFSG